MICLSIICLSIIVFIFTTADTKKDVKKQESHFSTASSNNNSSSKNSALQIRDIDNNIFQKIEDSKKEITAEDLPQNTIKYIENTKSNNRKIADLNKETNIKGKATITFSVPLSLKQLESFIKLYGIQKEYVSGQTLLTDGTLNTFFSNATILTLDEIDQITLESANNQNGFFLGYTSIRGIVDVRKLDEIQNSEMVILIETCKVSEGGDYLTNEYVDDLAWDISKAKGVVD